MMSKRLSVLVLLTVLTTLLIGGGVVSAQDDALDIWTKFNSDSPQNVQDEWMAQTVEAAPDVLGMELSNTFIPFDQIVPRLNVAVSAGGDVPDVSYVDSQYLGVYIQNGALMDLTEFVSGAEWFDDLDPDALAACTAPDGRILCVPSTSAIHFTYYWTEYFPDGYPTDTESFLTEAARIAEENPEAVAITFKGSELISVERLYYGLITSFGGQLADEEGRAVWANEETVAAVEFIRALFDNGYVSELALAPGFDYEEPFKDGTSASFVAGSYSYVFLTPIESPEGNEYDESGAMATGFDSTGAAVGAALEAGELGFAPPIAAPGAEPQTLVVASAWGIPMGSEDVEGAQAFINSQMTTEANTEFSIAYGALPTLTSAIESEAFSSPYWEGVKEYQSQYAIAAPPLADYALGMQLLADAITVVITDPSADIMTELEIAQEEYNLSIE